MIILYLLLKTCLAGSPLKSLYVDAGHYLYNNDPFVGHGYRLQNKLNLGVDLEFANKKIYFHNLIRSNMDTQNFRTVGWQYEIGARPRKDVELYINHFSNHILDAEVPYMAQSQTHMGIRVYFYQGK
jgi:hypothetical protein